MYSVVVYQCIEAALNSLSAGHRAHNLTWCQLFQSKEQIYDISFSPNGKRLAVLSSDKKVTYIYCYFSVCHAECGANFMTYNMTDYELCFNTFYVGSFITTM